MPGPPADEEAKWLTWQEYLGLCQELRHECAALDSAGRRRSEAAVAWSLQKYLIFAILSCVPDRQVRPLTGRQGAGLPCAHVRTHPARDLPLPLRAASGQAPRMPAALVISTCALRPPASAMHSYPCGPPLQRTLRELEVGRTLVRDREGRWVIRHGPEDYKAREGA